MKMGTLSIIINVQGSSRKSNIAGRTDNMKSTADIFKNNEITTEAIQKMLETCDESSEYIKGDMIYCLCY